MAQRIKTIYEIRDIWRTRERFFAGIEDDVAPHECHRWQGHHNPDGYGLISIQHIDGTRAMYRAHQVAWLLAHGSIPEDGLLLRHECDTRNCVNLMHLDLGTQADNMRDRDLRGRQAHRRGETNGKSKFSAEQVLAIRAHEDRYGLIAELAREYGVNAMSIVKIRNRITWTHI